MKIRPSVYNIFIYDTCDSYFLYNTLTGAVYKVDIEGKSAIENVEANKLTDEVVRDLKENGIWVDEQVDEKRIYKVLFDQHKYNGKRAYFCIYITYSCNLECQYCFLECISEGKKNITMNNETLQNTIKFIKNVIIENGCDEFVIFFTGGEPLKNIDRVLKILEKLYQWSRKRKIRFHCGIFSNGTLFNKDIINGLIRYNCFCQITLAGSRKIHDIKRPFKNGQGTFDVIIDNLKLLKENGMDFGIRVDIDRANYDSIEIMLEEVKNNVGKELYIKFFRIQPGSNVDESSWISLCFSEDDIFKILHLWNLSREKGFNVVISPLRKYTYCEYQTNRSFLIDPLGDVYKCGGVISDKKHRIGKIDSYGNLVDRTFEYFDWMSRTPSDIEVCKNCEYLPACGGGCAGMVYNKHKTYHMNDCSDKYLIKEIIRFYLDGFARESRADSRV